MLSLIRNLSLAVTACAVVAAAALAQGTTGDMQAPHHKADLFPPNLFPPWQHGANNDATKRGLEFTIPQVDVLADFHGSLTDPQLVLFVGGNYFFAMAPLVHAFEVAHPEFKGRIYWETIPPGLLVRQMRAGGTITVGNMTWTIRPDAYFAGLAKVKDLIKQGMLTSPAVPYATNTLTIMVPRGNPGHVTGLADMGKPGIRLAMPNPAFEGIAHQIMIALNKAGGKALESAVYQEKVKDGTTILTHIHHRQTPLFLMQGVAEAGVTWQSEAIFQEQVGHPIESIAIPIRDNATAIYAGALVTEAPHPQAATTWLDFIRSPTALQIFERYGFKPYTAG